MTGRGSLALGAAWRARGPILLLIGALVMHWLCYLSAGGAGSAGAEQVHAYLIGATPAAIVIAVSILAASLLAPFAAPGPRPRAVDLERRAARYAAVLISLFLAQEAAEVILAQGQASEPFGAAAWLVLPLAFALGLIAAVVERGLIRVERRLIGVARPRPLRGDTGPLPLRPAPRTSLSVGSLAFGLARRGPPLGR